MRRWGTFMADGKEAAAAASGGLKLGLGVAVAAAVAVAGWYFGLRPAPEGADAPAAVSEVAAPAVPAPEPAATPEPATPAPAPATTETEASAPVEAVAAPEPEAAGEEAAPDATASTATPEPEAAAPAAEAPPPAAPSFDTVRVDANGSVLVAGRAEAGALLKLMLDSAEVSRATADEAGAFATFFDIPPSDRPRSLSLIRLLPDGGEVMAEATILIAPFAAPEPPAVIAGAEGEVVGESDAAASVAAAPAAAPEVLIADAAGVRRQTPAESLSAIVIDTVGYSASGEVSIAGRGTAGSFARVYLDNKPLAETGIGDTGAWSAELAGIAPGVYKLRVDQVDGDGKVTSRFETPFQREAPETVAAALAPAPAPTPAAVAPTPAEAPAAGEVTAPATEAEPAAAPPAPARAGIVTVQPGFTLWRIARENYGDGVLYVKVFEANKDQIRDPDLIYPGQIFAVPTPE